MKQFDIEVAKWDDKRLDVFLKYRRWLLTQAPNNICMPGDTIATYAPFNSAGYQYRKQLGNLNDEPWNTILRQPPIDLVTANPFARSKFRKGFGVWDSVVGIPAPQIQTGSIIPMRQTPILRDINDTWRNIIAPALQRVGPLGQNHTVLRPEGPWIFDLTKMEDGWILLEAAHILAHLRGDIKPDNRTFGFSDSKTSSHWRAELAKIIIALAFDLPIDTMPQNDGRPAEPDFPCCGLEVKSSTYFDTPFLRCPWNGREALRFDETLAVVSSGVFLEPQPYGFNDGSLRHTPHDRWACAPTLVVIAGWQPVDIISKQPLVSINPEQRNLPVCYGVHPLDLMPPELFWAYLALCKKAGAFKEPDGVRYRYVTDWLNSKEFEQLLLQTPPLPCKYCARPNYRTQNAPRRPKGLMPRSKPKRAGIDAIRWQEWQTYVAEMKAIRGIIQRSTEEFSVQLYGKVQSKELRKQRKSGYRKRAEILTINRRIKDIERKKREGRRITRNDLLLYKRYGGQNNK